MKNLILYTLFSLFTNVIYTQSGANNYQFELGFRTGSFINSELLYDTRFSHAISDPSIDDDGLMPVANGFLFGLSGAVAKQLNNSGFVIARLSYDEYNENAQYFCHLCDFFSSPYALSTVKLLNFGLGYKKELLNLEKHGFGIEAF